MTHVLVDATPLGDDSAYRGIGTYLRELLAGLACEKGLSVSVLCRRVTPLPEGLRAIRLWRGAPGRWRPTEHELLLPLDLLRARADVFHSPALSPPWRCPYPWVQTLHDVIPLVFDDPELAVERRRWHRHAARYRRAKRIIAVSRYSADIGISVLGLDPARIEVIHHGVDPRFRPRGEGRASRRESLLVVGEYSRRKGYAEAFGVVGALAEHGYPHRLRVTGRIAPWIRPTVEAVVAAAPSPERIELLGFVDDLVAEYQQAQLLVMSSRYEGFGFPALEAMACGTPVVAFANSSITEVVGDAGILVTDGDVGEMTRAVRSVLDDETLWADLSARGLERVKQFSWQKSVDAHAEMLRAVAAR